MESKYVYSEILKGLEVIAVGSSPLTIAPDAILQGGTFHDGLTFADANYHWHDVLNSEDIEFASEVILSNINEGDDTEGEVELDSDYRISWRIVTEEEMTAIMETW